MYCRVLKREEFVQRMLAEQELRREQRRKARYAAADAIGAICYERAAKALRDKKRRRRR